MPRCICWGLRIHLYPCMFECQLKVCIHLYNDTCMSPTNWYNHGHICWEFLCIHLHLELIFNNLCIVLCQNFSPAHERPTCLNPCLQIQRYEPGEFWHSESIPHTNLFFWPFRRHSLMSSQMPLTCLYPGPQEHLYDPIVFTQDAPWKQDAMPVLHSSISSHLPLREFSRRPISHIEMHSKLPIELMHFSPGRHAPSEKHSSTSYNICIIG